MGSGEEMNSPERVKKLVRSVKEIVGGDLTDAEVYAVLRECKMDPDEAVNRLLPQVTEPIDGQASSIPSLSSKSKHVKIMEEANGESCEQSSSTNCLVSFQPMHADPVLENMELSSQPHLGALEYREAEEEVVCPFCQEELALDQDLVTCCSCHQATHKTCFLGFIPHLEPATKSISCPLCRKVMSKWSWYSQFAANDCNFCKRVVRENSTAVLCLKCGAPIHFLCFLAWVDEDIKLDSLICRGCGENLETWELYKQLEDKYLFDPNSNCGRCMKEFVAGDLMFNIIECDHFVCDECLLTTLASNRCPRCGVRIEELPPWPYRFIEVNYGLPFVPLNADYEEISWEDYYKLVMDTLE